MTSALDAPWFYWAVGVAIGFPIGLILLTELHNALRRRGSILARPVHLVRNYILPLGALLILLVRSHADFRRDDTGAHRCDGVRFRRAGAAAVGH